MKQIIGQRNDVIKSKMAACWKLKKGSLFSFLINIYTPNCNNVVIEKCKKNK